MALEDDFERKMINAIFGNGKELFDDMMRDVRISEDQVRRKCLSCKELFWGEPTDIECMPCRNATEQGGE